MEMYTYIEALASSQSAPGGGSAAAYAGTMGAALGNMVLNITIEKQKGADIDLLTGLVKQMTSHQEALFALVQGDEDASNQLFGAFKLPKTTDQEKADRVQAIQAGLKIATEVPLEIMDHATEALEIMTQVASLGRKSVMADVTVGTTMLKTAIQAANENVEENVLLLKDENLQAALGAKGKDLIQRSEAAIKTITETVASR